MTKTLLTLALTGLISACVTPAKPKPTAAYEKAPRVTKDRLDLTEQEVATLNACATAAGDAPDAFKTKCAKRFVDRKLFVVVDRVEASGDSLHIFAGSGVGAVIECHAARKDAPKITAGDALLVSGFVSHFEENKNRKAGWIGPKETTTYQATLDPCRAERP